ncbi:MAG: hypothetical protein ACI9CE_001297 [Flavobacterium sp.]|jgi:hypothetical protein
MGTPLRDWLWAPYYEIGYGHPIKRLAMGTLLRDWLWALLY